MSDTAEGRTVADLFPDESLPSSLVAGAPFQVDTRDKAEWAMSKLARAEERITAATSAADRAIDNIRSRLEQITKHDKALVEQLAEMIRPWAELEIARAGKRKSMKLLNGEVGFRQNPTRLEIADEEALIESLKEAHPECIRVEISINKAETKKLIESTGELPEGANLIPGDVRFYIKAARVELGVEAKEAIE